MLHIQLITPPDLTAAALAILDEEPGVAHLIVQRGAAMRPAGDVVICDITRDSLDTLLDRLRAIGCDRRGGITIMEPDAVISRDAEAAVRADWGADPIVWEEVAARTSEDAALSPGYLILMACAAIIAAIAVLSDSIILVVGAMIVSPDFGPIAGLAVAVVERRADRARASFVAMIAGFALASLAAFVFTVVFDLFVDLPVAYMSGKRPLTQFIAAPDRYSFIVAVVAGIAGMISLGNPKSGAVVGVLVSITTIPAAANLGIALAAGRFAEVQGALTQLLVNIAGLFIAGIATLAHRRVH